MFSCARADQGHDVHDIHMDILFGPRVLARKKLADTRMLVSFSGSLMMAQMLVPRLLGMFVMPPPVMLILRNPETTMQ